MLDHAEEKETKETQVNRDIRARRDLRETEAVSVTTVDQGRPDRRVTEDLMACQGRRESEARRGPLVCLANAVLMAFMDYREHQENRVNKVTMVQWGLLEALVCLQ